MYNCLTFHITYYCKNELHQQTMIKDKFVEGSVHDNSNDKIRSAILICFDG